MSTLPQGESEADGVAAVHFAGRSVWCTSRTSAHGQRPAGETATGVDALKFVDDERMTVDGVDVATVDVIRDHVRQALLHNGLSIRPALLVVTHPPHWGERRRGVLYSAARPLGAEVVLVDSAVVAADSAAAAHRDTSSVMVVDGCAHRATVTAVAGPLRRPGACRLVHGIDSEDDTVADALRSAVKEVTEVARPTLAVLHDSSEFISRDDVRSVSGIPVVEVGGSEIVSALLDTGALADADPAGPRFDPAPPIASRAPAWLAARPQPKSRQQQVRESITSARVGIATTLVVGLVVSAAALWWVSGSPTDATVAAVQSVTARATSTAAAMETTDAAPMTTESTDAAPITTERPPTRLTLGRVTIVVPDGWHTEPGPERMNVLPDTGSGMRILLVSREIRDSYGTDEVIATLQRKFAEPDNDGRFDQLTTDTLVAGLPGLTYVESPSDGSSVDWYVLVSARLQVSLGCQSSPERRSDLTDVCAGVLESLNVVEP